MQFVLIKHSEMQQLILWFFGWWAGWLQHPGV
jgi:hypothetical protein